jgi:hypothetical protein
VSNRWGGPDHDPLAQDPAKYRPHRPQSADFQGFRAGGIIMGHRPPVDHYRAPRQVPTAYRPSKISSVCRYFILCAVPAVGAVDTFLRLGALFLCVYPCAGATSMHLARDYIHPYKDAGERPAWCRVRIYLPDDEHDAPVVICSELPSNSGASVTNSAETIAAGVIRANELPTLLV